MLKVGVPTWVDEELLKKFPQGVHIERIEPYPERTIEVEFCIAPISPKEGAALLPRLQGLRVIQSLQAGVDWLRKLLPPGVILCDGQGLHNIPTAEWTVAAILATLKNFPLYVDLQRTGDWGRRKQPDETPGHSPARRPLPLVLSEELSGKRVMIVGYGSIGQSIEERLLPFGVKIIRIARTARPGVEDIARMPHLLPQADIVVLIVPLTEETHGMIGERELAQMKRGALLVNAARGPVVQTDALLAALNSGHIRAALDVTDPEPLPPGHPLWSAPNLFLTPHVAGFSPLTMARATDLVVAQVERYLKGEPLQNVVTGSY